MFKRILLALFIGTLIPVPQTVVPAWNALVVDESGKPQADADVRQVWRQYSLESTTHHETLRTGADGMVHFPRRVLWRPPIVNIYGIIRNRVMNGDNANFGPVAYLVASYGNEQSFGDRCENCRLVLHAMRDVR
jgi:hypothetical protein